MRYSERVQLGGDPADAGKGGEPQEPHQVILQGFRTVSQTLSGAYGAASLEIQKIIQRALRTSTTEDQTFIWGASGAIRQWVDSVRLAMACLDKSTEDQSQLLADARQAGKDALKSILSLLPEEEEPWLTPVFPHAADILDLALTAARWHTNTALRNICTQLSDLVKEHVPPEQTRVFFNTILQVTCSFWQEMDNMATSQVFLPSQIIPTLWGTCRGLLEGLSLLGPPSCSASWPASLVERVTAVPAPQAVLGLPKTPAKPSTLVSGAGKATPEYSKKKSQVSAKQVAGLFWKDPERGKEDAEARKQEEKHRKKFTGPVLSLDDHEDSVTTCTDRAAPSRVSQPPSKTPATSSKGQNKTRRNNLPVTDLSDDKPLSDKADEPKPKRRKRDITPELVILDDDSTPLPGKSEATGKKSHNYTPDEEEALETLSQHLKGEAQAVQYTLELTVLTEYRNLYIPNLKGSPNTDDHSAYLSKVKDISWSYLVKGNVISAHQFFKELQASKDQEAIDLGDTVLWEKGMLGVPHESLSKGTKMEPIKAWYIIWVLHSIEGQIIDARDIDYGRDWNIGLYDIVSPASTKKVERGRQLAYKGRIVKGKVYYGYCPFCTYALQNHRTLNNHIRMHLHLTLACGMLDCWFITHGLESMWKHAATHRLTTSEPIAVYSKKK